MLRNLGYAVETAANGRLAVEAASHDSFDAVLMDIQMPELDGYAATAQLRRREAESGRDRVPVIALTANALAEDRDQALAAGMDDHLPKPVHQKQLQLTLSRWVGPPPVVSRTRGSAGRTSCPLDQQVLEGCEPWISTAETRCSRSWWQCSSKTPLPRSKDAPGRRAGGPHCGRPACACPSGQQRQHGRPAPQRTRWSAPGVEQSPR